MKRYLLITFTLLVCVFAFGQQNNAALSFDGNQQVRLNNYFDPDDYLTIEFWIKPDFVSGGVQTIYSVNFSVDQPGGGFSFEQYINIFIDNSDLHVELRDGVTEVGGAVQKTMTYSFGTILTTDWTHVAVVIDGTTLTGYLNKQFTMEEVIVPITASGFVFPFHLIGTSAGDINYLNADLDEFRIWNDPRTELEIASNYYKMLSGNEEDLAVYYDFNEGIPLADNFVDGEITVEFRNYDEKCGGNCPPGQEGIPVLETFFDSTITHTASTTNEFFIYYLDGSGPENTNSDYWTAYMTGTIRAPETSTYNFEVISNDGVIVLLNGEVIFENWVIGTTNLQAEVDLIAGQEYMLEILYFDALGIADMLVYWSSPNLSRQVIPTYISLDDKSGNGAYGTFSGAFGFTGDVSNYVNFEGPKPVITDIQPSRVSTGDTLLIKGTGLDIVTLDLNGLPLSVIEQTPGFIKAIIPADSNVPSGLFEIGGRINYSGKYVTLISERSSAAFATSTPVTSFLDGQNSLSGSDKAIPVDLDGDGDLDLVVGSEGNAGSPNLATIGWFENLDGRGNYGGLTIIYKTSFTPEVTNIDFVVSDLNRDNFPDIVIADSYVGIRWISNRGDGSFTNPSTTEIYTQTDFAAEILPLELEIADFTGDGLHDIVFTVESYEFNASFDSGLFIIEQDVTGFLAPRRVSSRYFTRDTGNDRIYPNTIELVDFNYDSHLDIMAATRDGLAIYVNDGSGYFAEEILVPLDRETKEIVNIQAGDLENDGDVDVIATVQYPLGVLIWDYGVELIINDNSQFTPFEIEKYGVISEVEVVADLVDIDGDGDLDIISFSDDEIILRQDLNGASDFSGPVVIDRTSAKQLEMVTGADIDLDGRLDLVTVSSFDSKVTWFNNRYGPVSGIFPKEATSGDFVKIAGNNFSPVISDNIVLFNDIEVVLDQERSNGKEIFAQVPTQAKGIQRLEIISSNTGDKMEIPPFNFTVIDDVASGVFWEEQLTESTEGDTLFTGAELVDLDNDNDLDLVVSAGRYSTLVIRSFLLFYENIGNNEFQYRTAVNDPGLYFGQPTSPTGVSSRIISLDIENDGFNDIVCGAGLVRNIDGNFNFGDPELYSSGASFQSVTYGDINKDGYNDIVASTYAFSASSRLVVYLNDGKDFFGEEIVVNVSSSQVTDIVLMDVDEDGDLDILTAEPRLDKIGWFENIDGQGNFNPTEKVIDSSIEGVKSIAVDDIDNDGDLDLVAGGGTSNNRNQAVPVEIAWFKNLQPGLFSEKIAIDTLERFAFDGVIGISISDLNGNGSKDLLVDVNDGYTYIVDGFPEGFGKAELLTDQTSSSRGPVVGDLNNDGDIDLVIPKETRILVYENIWLEANILDIESPALIQAAIVNTADSLVNIEVADTVDLVNFKPKIIVTQEAVFEQQSTDFADTVKFLVFAEIDNTKEYDEDFSQLWSVVTTKVPVPPVADTVSVNQTSAIIGWEADRYSVGFTLEVSDNNQFLSDFVSGPEPLSAGEGITELSVSGLRPGTRYFARMKASNTYGSLSKYSSRIDFLTRPGIPLINEVNNSTISSTQARVSWSAAAGQVDEYLFYLQQNVDGGFQNVEGYPLNVLTSTSVTLGEDFSTGFLSAGVNYRTFVKAKNETGFSPASEIVSFTTLSSADGINLSLENIGKTQFEVNWDAARGASHYILELSDDDFETVLPGYQNLKVLNPDTLLGNLNTGTAYSVRLRVANAIGLSDDNSVAKTVTLPDNPQILPIELQKITTSTAEIDWDPVVGNAIVYEVEVTSTDFSSGSTLVDGYPLSITESRIELGRDFSTNRLNSGTSYRVRVRARNSTGYSDYSNEVQFKSLPEQPFVSVDRESVGQDSINISWTEIAGSDEYLLDVSLDNFRTFVPGYSQLSIPETNYTIESLTNGEYYFIRLFATNSSGNSLGSNTSEVLLKPGTPLARGAADITPISFTANWDPVQRVESYQLQISETQTFADTVLLQSYDEANPVDITGLREGQQYFYRVRAENATGFSTYSNVVTLTTINPDPITITLTYDELFDTSEDNVVGVLVTGGFGERNASYRWKSIGSNDWSDFLNLTSLSFGQYQFVVQPAMLDNMGVEFEIKVVDELGREQITTGNFMFVSLSEDEGISLPLAIFGGTGNSWELFSIPYELEDNLIESIFDEVASKQYKKEWRLMQYASSGAGGSYIDFGEGLNRIELGNSYWFNAIERVTIELGNGQATTQVPFTISLDQGWNQIGNPYNIPIEWNRVLLNNDASGVVGNLINYQGINPERGTVLEPFRGSFVFAEQSIDINILPSNSIAVAGRVDINSAGASEIDLEPDWLIDLKVTSNREVVDHASIGMAGDASPTKDQYDIMKAPRFISYTELASKVPEYFYSSFERDIRPESAVATWNFNFLSNRLKGRAGIQWDQGQVMSSGKPIYLVDLSSGMIVDMRSTSEIMIAAERSADLRVYYGKELDEIDFADVLLVGEVYPNPVERDFSIPLILPRDQNGWTVEVNLYNVQGREMLRNSDFIQTGGYSLLDVSLAGGSLPAGVYLMSVSVRGVQEMMVQQKIIIR